MTKEDLFKAIDEVDLKLLDSAIRYKPHKKINLASIGTVAAVLLVVFGVALVANGNINKIFNFTSTTTGLQVSSETETTMSVVYAEPSWNEKNITGKFPSVIYAGREYLTLSYSEDQKISKKIGNILSSEVAYGTRPSTNEEESAKVTVYSLESMSPEFMIAVKFEGHDGLYAYANGLFKVSSFGEFLSSTDFVNIVNFGDFTFGIGEIEHKGELLGDKATLLSFFKDDMPWCEDDTDFVETLIEIRVDAPEIGISNRCFAVYANGSVQTNLFNHVAYTFKMSENDFEQFKNYISGLKEKIPEPQINNSFESSEITTQIETTLALNMWE